MKAIILTLALVVGCASPSNRTVEPGVSARTVSKFTVEDIKMVKDFSNAWTVKCMVRNNTGAPVRIAAKVSFLNTNGDITLHALATVNGFDETPAGKAAVMEYTTAPSDFDGVVSYKIEPYDREDGAPN